MITDRSLPAKVSHWYDQAFHIMLGFKGLDFIVHFDSGRGEMEMALNLVILWDPSRTSTKIGPLWGKLLWVFSSLYLLVPTVFLYYCTYPLLPSKEKEKEVGAIILTRIMILIDMLLSLIWLHIIVYFLFRYYTWFMILYWINWRCFSLECQVSWRCLNVFKLSYLIAQAR